MGQLGAVIVAADRAFHVIACRFGQYDRVLGTVQVKHCIPRMKLIGNRVIAQHNLDLPFVPVWLLDVQIRCLNQSARGIGRRKQFLLFHSKLVFDVHALDRSHKGLIKQAKRKARDGKRQQHSQNIRRNASDGRQYLKDTLAEEVQHRTKYEQQQCARQNLFDHRPAHVTLKVTWQAERLLGHKN